MIMVVQARSTEATEFAPAMAAGTGILPGLPAVAGKPVHFAFDGGRLTSDAGILLLAAVEQRLKIAERLAVCLEDPRDPDRVRHELAGMIRYRALLIAAGYPDGNDCDALRSDPVFKMAVGRLPESGRDLCSQPTISRLENLPGATALKRMMAAMVELFCDSFDQVPRRILLDIDDTEDRVHGVQQLALWNAHYDSRCFLPIHIYEATTGKPVAVILRPGKTPDGVEVALVLRHVIGRIRIRWPAVEIIVRGDSHYGRPEAMAWCERQRIGYIFGLAGNKVLLRQVGPLAAVSPAKALYDKVYCGRGQAKNLIKAHKLHLASDRTSCRKATANQFRLLIHTAAYWLMLTLRGIAPRNSFWREAQFATTRLCLIKVAARVTEMVTPIKVALPSAFPYPAGFADLAARIAKVPP